MPAAIFSHVRHRMQVVAIHELGAERFGQSDPDVVLPEPDTPATTTLMLQR